MARKERIKNMAVVMSTLYMHTKRLDIDGEEALMARHKDAAQGPKLVPILCSVAGCYIAAMKRDARGEASSFPIYRSEVPG